ncbi:hypothetical protein GCM10010420_01530 [Streptomyces glaucosporus]|uniref:VCBS repeat-containing protein n=1 Tax=Streptomyces glaucosporus TaxID=284044 RepID=A0ABN3HLE1_9ACTN
MLLPVSAAQASGTQSGTTSGASSGTEPGTSSGTTSGASSGTEPGTESASDDEPDPAPDPEPTSGTDPEPAPEPDPEPEPGTAPASADECAALPLASFGDPGDAVGRASIPADGSVCHTFTAERPGLHRVLLDDRHNETYVQVFDGETQLECYDAEWSSAGWCDLPRAGAFTLKLVNGGWEPEETSVTVVPLASTEGCEPETGTSWDLDPVTGTSASPVGLLCHPFTGKSGERITLDARTVRYGQAERWITDGTGARICPRTAEDGGTGCVLPGDGPYRVLLRVTEAEGGFPADYTLKVRRLSDPEGCARVPVNAYGSAPTTVDPATGCKVFTAPAAGTYEVHQVHESGSRSPVGVYDRAGKTVCETWDSPCSLPAAGDYTLLTDQAVLVLDRTSTEGCETVGLGVHQGSFAVAGEIDCLRLPLPEGSRMAALTSLSGSRPAPEMTVVDAGGAYQCGGSRLSEGTCDLSGTAPFRLLASTDDDDRPTGAYRVALHRTDAAGDCPAVPAGDFTDASASARFATGDGVFSHCLTVPADDHAAAEVLQLRTVSGNSTARFSVLDGGGKQVCFTYAALSAWTTCPLTPGDAHTVLVTGRDATAEYTLTRRDVTEDAEGCAANPATPVGGPSTGGPLGAPGELLCRQVTTGDAGDVLHLDVRDPLGTAGITVHGADGEAVCSKSNKSCAVTGSTSYQVLVAVPSGKEAAGTYRFDALRIATADGPAEECEKVPDISYGYGPVTGVLDEEHTAVCAAFPTAYRDSFETRITDTEGGTETAVPALYDAGLEDGCTWSTAGWRCGVYEPYSREVSPSILVLGLPEKASRTAYSAEFTCFSSLCGMEKITVGQVTPAGGVSGGTVKVTVTGTALHEDDKVRITRSGTTVESTGTSVSADRKTLTAALDLTGAAAGAWNLSVITHNGWEHAKGTFTVEAAPLRSTAAPKITGTARVGSRLAVSPGTWDAAPDSYTHQWKADGQAIPGATGSTYLVPASLRGKKVTVAVTAHRSGRQDATAESPARTIAAAPRDHAGADSRPDGLGDLLTLSSGGWMTFQQGSGKGTFSGKTSASGWSPKVTAVPFGDLNGDGCNDVLVRMADGTLRGYQPGCGKALTTSTPYTSLGSGWGAYNVLTSPGDITGDGRADLIARKSSTGDVYLFAATSTGKLKAGVKIRSKWTYTHIVGAGDLDGDGHGDLLARTKDGTLYRYDGTASGQFGSRVVVFTKWGGSYNAIVGAGDITGDGKADLVARDTSGNLYRNTGDGKGSFSGRTKIGTGWGGYKGLF